MTCPGHPIVREDKKHRALISSLCCCVCGAQPPSECAHVRMGHFGGVTVPLHERGGMGLKPSDKWTVPLCRACHRVQHMGETTFWLQQDKNPLQIAAALWRNTGNAEACRGIVGRARMGVAL